MLTLPYEQIGKDDEKERQRLAILWQVLERLKLWDQYAYHGADRNQHSRTQRPRGDPWRYRRLSCWMQPEAWI